MASWKQMTYRERLLLEVLYEDEGMSTPKLAEKLGYSRVSLWKELKKGYTGRLNANGKPGYSADLAQRLIDIGRMHQKQSARNRKKRAPKTAPEANGDKL